MSAFCQGAKGTLRCVAGAGHIGSHDFQPQSSASVRAIMRQEALDARLAGERTSGAVKEGLLRREAEASVRLDGETRVIEDVSESGLPWSQPAP